MFGSSDAWGTQRPSFPPCVVLRDPDKDTVRCGRPATGGHTVLANAICPECYEAVADATLHTSPEAVQVPILGGL